MLNRQPTLTGDTLKLRPLRVTDFSGLFRAASDPKTWAGHPVSNRHQETVFRTYFDDLLASNATLVIIDQTQDKIIGCSRYYTGPDRPETISIGFTFLHHSYWGGETNFALKTLMLDHAFIDYDDVWFHIAPTNIRSQKATMKLGAVFIEDALIDLGAGAANWKTYRLTRENWEKRRG